MKQKIICRIGLMTMLALFLGFYGSPRALAQTEKLEQVFEIRDVHVDITSTTAEAAKTLAIQQGQRQALDLLFRKIVKDSDLAKIPTLDDTWLNNLVSGLEFNNEKTSGIRYIADLTVSFHKDGIYNLLQRLGIPFSETSAKPMLLLPVQRFAGTTTLWSDQNWWQQAWSKADTANRLVDLILPKGDLSDRLAVNAEQAFRQDPAGLTAAAKKYGVEDVLIATANITQDFSSGAYQVHVEARKWPQGGKATAIDVAAGPNESLEDLLNRSAEALTKRLSDDWKQQTLSYFGKTFELAVHIPLRTLDDWITLEKRLSNVGAIRKAEINSLTVSGADLTLLYSGQPDQLALALAQTNIDLAKTNGTWTMALKRAGDSAGDNE